MAYLSSITEITPLSVYKLPLLADERVTQESITNNAHVNKLFLQLPPLLAQRKKYYCNRGRLNRRVFCNAELSKPRVPAKYARSMLCHHPQRQNKRNPL